MYHVISDQIGFDLISLISYGSDTIWYHVISVISDRIWYYLIYIGSNWILGCLKQGYFEQRGLLRCYLSRVRRYSRPTSIKASNDTWSKVFSSKVTSSDVILYEVTICTRRPCLTLLKTTLFEQSLLVLRDIGLKQDWHQKRVVSSKTRLRQDSLVWFALLEAISLETTTHKATSFDLNWGGFLSRGVLAGLEQGWPQTRFALNEVGLKWGRTQVR